MTNDQMLLIHKVIHKLVTPHNGVKFGDQNYMVRTRAGKGLRYIQIADTMWIEQNPAKSSDSAARARAGARITWGIRDTGPWAHIENEQILNR